jgi:hypothetical protein
MQTKPGPPPDPDETLATLRADIGVATPWRRFEVTAADAARFRSAVDPAARGAGSGSAGPEPPPMFFSPDPIILSQRLGLLRHRPYPNTLDGGTRWQWLAPLRVGDTVQLRAEIVDVDEKVGSKQTGRMFLTTVLVTCAALNGEAIARCWGTSISYEGVAS